MNAPIAILKVGDWKFRTSNDVLRDIYPIQNEEDVFTRENIPSTLGSLINRFSKAFLSCNIFQNNEMAYFMKIRDFRRDAKRL